MIFIKFALIIIGLILLAVMFNSCINDGTSLSERTMKFLRYFM